MAFRAEDVYSEEDLLPLSSLQHLAYCERQCALILSEGLWKENRLTVEGEQLHSRVDAGAGESRRDLRIARSVRLHSFHLGLSGCADVVELHRFPEAAGGIVLPGLDGRWRPLPVEYKRGRPKVGPEDRIQLCAQAMCLEEMLGGNVSEGALYYAATRHRQAVAIDASLRRQTELAAARRHALASAETTPPAVLDKKCRRCSLRPLCLPEASGRSARTYLQRALVLEVEP